MQIANKRTLYRIISALCFIGILILLQTLLILAGIGIQTLSDKLFFQYLLAGFLTSLVPVIVITFLCYFMKNEPEG